MGILKKIKELIFGNTELVEAIPLDTPLKLQAVWSNEPQTIHRYSVKYGSNLTPQQMNKIITSIINKFSPDCRPANLTVSVSYLYFTFYSPCMSGERLKGICESILEGTSPSNHVVSVILDGDEIWPQKTQTKKK